MKNTHRISVSCPKRLRDRWPEAPAIIRASVRAALKCNKVLCGCEVNVLCTDDDGIRIINSDNRGKDMPTDVLSFPMLELKPGENLCKSPLYDRDPDTGRVFLGDICISLECAQDQAERFGHGVKREIAYLTVHSVLHLLGYDHEQSVEAEMEMTAKAEEVMVFMGIPR